MAGIKRLVFLCGTKEENARGIEVAKEILKERKIKYIDLEFEKSKTAELFGEYKEVRIDNMVYSEWCPPRWWPKVPTAILCHSLDSTTDIKALRKLCDMAVITDIDDRKVLPKEKLPDGSFFVIQDNEDGAVIEHISSISDDVAGEILKLSPPFEKEAESKMPHARREE